MDTYYKSILIRAVEQKVEEYNILYPAQIIGDCTIIGAFPEFDLVLMGQKNPEKIENKHTCLREFNKDEDVVYGDIMILKTNESGNTIDFTINDYEKIYEFFI